MTLLPSQKMKNALLNLPLLGLFGCAWVSDHWPNLMAPALIVAVLIVIGEIVLLVVFEKFRSRKIDPQRQIIRSPEISRPLETPTSNASAVTIARAYDLAVNDYRAALNLYASGELARHHFLAMRRLQQLQRQVRASSLKGTTLSILAEQKIYLMSLDLERRRSPALLCDTWQVIPQGEDAFTVDAGAFAIEHFGGKTNIRILDPLRVTVESETRGVPVESSPSAIRTENYH